MKNTRKLIVKNIIVTQNALQLPCSYRLEYYEKVMYQNRENIFKSKLVMI